MMKRSFAFLLSAALVSGVWAFAQGSPDSTTVLVRGTIEKYDPSTRTLSISTPNATVQFPLSSTARIRQGWHKIAVSDLDKFSGYHAAVRYLESRGNKTVESIHVFGKSERPGR
jgi:hypothetical protein